MKIVRESLNILKGPSEEDALESIKGDSPNEILNKGAKFGSLMLVKMAIERGADIHDDDDWPVQLAAKYGHLDVVKYLVENGADIEAWGGWTLQIAAKNGHLNVVKYLVENGADIHSDDDDPLLLATYQGHLDVVKYLVENGANINVRNNLVLRYASDHDIIEYFKQQMGITESLNILKGPSEENAMKAIEGMSPEDILSHAGKFGSLTLAKIAVERGVDVESETFPFCISAENGHLDVVKYLVEQGADIHAGEDYAVRWAAAKGHLDVVKYLVENGADFREYNDLALEYAMDNGHLDVANYLNNEMKKKNSNNESMKAKFVKKINEWGGAGFSMGSSIYPVNRGGQMNRGGFGGANNLGGPNMMYTYEIKPLTRNLQPKPTNFEIEEKIHAGHYIEGQELNKKDDILHRGTVLSVKQTEDGDVMYYVILCDETSSSMKIDPTTAVLLSGDSYIDPENGVKNRSNDQADLLRRGEIKETIKAKFVNEAMAKTVQSTVDEFLTWYANTSEWNEDWQTTNVMEVNGVHAQDDGDDGMTHLAELSMLKNETIDIQQNMFRQGDWYLSFILDEKEYSLQSAVQAFATEDDF